MRDESVRSRLLANSGLLLAMNMSAAALNFAISIVIGRGLGQTGFGQYSFVMAWAFSFGQFAEMGLNTLATRDVAQARSQAGRVLVATMAIKTAASIPLMIGLWIAAPRIGSSTAAVTLLRAAAPMILLTSLYGSITALFRAYERMAPILFLSSGGLALQCAGALLLMRANRGPADLIVLALAVQAVQLAAGWTVLRPARGSPGGWDTAFARRMLRRAAPFAIAGVLGAIELRAVTILLGYLGDAAAVGRFSVASKLGELARLAPNSFLAALFPTLSTLAARRDDPAGLEVTARASTAVLFGVGTAAAIALCLLARPIVALAYGVEFAGATGALRWIACAIPIALPGTSLEMYLYARGHEGFVNRVTAVGLIVLVGTGVPLMIRWGATGAAAAVFLMELAMIGPLYRKRVRLGDESR